MLSASQRSHLVQVLNKSREELKERYNKIDLADTNSNSETVPLCQIILVCMLLLLFFFSFTLSNRLSL
jgi:hypothetical protein